MMQRDSQKNNLKNKLCSRFGMYGMGQVSQEFAVHTSSIHLQPFTSRCYAQFCVSRCKQHVAYTYILHREGCSTYCSRPFCDQKQRWTSHCRKLGQSSFREITMIYLELFEWRTVPCCASFAALDFKARKNVWTTLKLISTTSDKRVV